jgi:hypothetical protein
MKFAYLDFEYNRSSDKFMNVVCCSLLVDGATHNFWTNNGINGEISYFLDELKKKEYTLVSFAAEAEASSIFSLGYNPLDFRWIDLQLEVKMLYNHNNLLATGKHLMRGREVYIKPFSEKPQTNLASSLYKFCNVKIDTDHKTEMRDIIISQDNDKIEANKQAIMDYCASDVKYLPKLFKSIMDHYSSMFTHKEKANLREQILLRGEYSARTALMVRHGTPINMEWAKNLAANVPIALNECIQDINSQFTDIKPFKFDKRSSKYVMDTKVLRDWIKAQKFPNWQLTETKQVSLALEAWEDHFNFRHEFPRGNLGAQMVRFFKLRQSLNSFNFKEGQKESTFFDYVGSDNYSRPYMNHFGAQSSRTQPKSSGFLFLKSAWMRSLCQPPKGYAIGGIDYSSQEFLLGAVCSRDPKMIQAYKEGDVYLYYGKGIGLIPKEGTKQTHSFERDLCKSTVLGLSYLMTKVGLAKKLTADTGKVVTEDEAEKLVEAYDSLFSVFSSWRESVGTHYKISKKIQLPDGWTMFGDNPSHRSTANMPLQGAGAACMRKAVALAQDAGLNIIFTLHDALYIMEPSDKIADAMDTLARCMKEAFIFYFDEDQKQSASLIRLDGKVWGPEMQEGELITKMNFKLESSKYHIDKRAKAEYDQFSRFFTESPSIELL